MTETVQVTETQTPRSRREITVILLGLMSAMLLAFLDNMIVGPAMPTILREIGGANGVSHLSWVVTGYILASTVSTPLWGKFGDLFGRKLTFLTSIVLFLIGSALAGAAWDMMSLIGFRAFQGLGAGGLMVGAMALIGDLVSPRERGKYQGVMGAVMALAMIGGPLVGGFITDNLSWRWAFYINLPLGAVSFAVLWFTLHLPKKKIEHKIDYPGAALLTVAITAIVLITTWGGTQYAWKSPQIITLIIVGVLSTIAFVLVERRAVEPIIPLRLFRNGNFSVVSGIGFLVGFSMFGAITFLPLYQQTVQGASATNSGLLLTPMMLAMLVVSLFVGQFVTRTGRYKIFPVIGGLGMTAGMYLLSTMGADTTKKTTALFMVVLGLGMGFLMQITMLITQNSVELKDMGAASGAATFFRSIGGSFGVSLFGAIFTHRLQEKMGTLGGGGKGAGVDASKITSLPEPMRHVAMDAIAFATSGVFKWAVAFTAVAFVLAWFIKEVPLRGGPTAEPAEAAAQSPELAMAD